VDVRILVEPGGTVEGESGVPGDKSIAHRWLILSATARGTSMLMGLPAALDVGSTARCLAAVVGAQARPRLEAWGSILEHQGVGTGFTVDGGFGPSEGQAELVIEGQGRDQLHVPGRPLDCGNSGTTMRLLIGVLAASPFPCTLTGDESLRARPMERVAAPLREMGALVSTDHGHPPVEVRGGALRGIRHELAVPTAQAKGAILLAGLAADGWTTVVEPARTRDHTERALRRLGAPVRQEEEEGTVSVSRFQHDGFEAEVPGDVSSAAFLVGAATLTGGELTIRGVGLNPTRTHFLSVLDRMGVGIEPRVAGEELGEPVGELFVARVAGLRGTEVTARELPLVIDEVPVLAALAAHAEGESRFAGGAELRAKESDRLAGVAEMVRDLGGRARVEGEDLVIEGGGLAGGRASARRDHRLAMAAAVAALRARAACEIDGMEWSEVSFPGFLTALRVLGARVGAA
jgi:3-phosphoshikimate 1-carboxyvinyltransferase